MNGLTKRDDAVALKRLLSARILSIIANGIRQKPTMRMQIPAACRTVPLSSTVGAVSNDKPVTINRFFPRFHENPMNMSHLQGDAGSGCRHGGLAPRLAASIGFFSASRSGNTRDARSGAVR